MSLCNDDEVHHSILEKRRRTSNNSVVDLIMDDDDAEKKTDNSQPAGPRHAVPWLMFSHGERGKEDQTFFNICKPNETYVKSLPEFHRKGRRFYQSPSSSCNQGWLIVTDDNSNGIDCSMWNTVSSEKMQLPPIELKFSKRIIDAVCSFPFPGESMVMFLLYHTERHESLLLFCHPGDKYWIIRKLHFKSFESNIGAFVEFKGKVYVMCRHLNRYLVIERNDNPEGTLSVMRAEYLIRTTFVIGPRSSISTHGRRCHLKYVQSGDELFMVCLEFHRRFRKEVVMELKVFRMDFSLIEWKEVTSLGDHVLFLGIDSTASCFATDIGLEKGGYVYFTLDEDASLYKFDLEKGTISLSLPCPNIPMLPFSHKWVIMPISRTTKDGKNKDMISKEPEKNQIIKNEEEGEDMRTWEVVLHANIWQLITRNLNPVDYMHFRAACREFRSVAPPVKWRTTTNTTRFKETDSLSPWLVFLEKNDGICNFIDSMHNKDKYLMNLSDILLDAKIHYSKDGWLLMSKDKKSMFFFNPFTREIIILPGIRQNDRFQGICFSSTPTSADCLVFAIVGDIGCSADFFYFRPPGISWTRLSLHDPLLFREYKVSLNNPVFYNGAFYCLDCDGTLGVFHISNGRVNWNVYGKNQQPCSLFSQCFLVECEGELLAVFLGHWGEWVKVFRFVRFPEDEINWVEVKSLGKHMLFISHTSCLSAVAPRSGMESRIYFSRFISDKGIMYYSLDTCTYHSSESQHSHQNFCDTDEQLYSSWIEPMWSNNTTDEDLNWY